MKRLLLAGTALLALATVEPAAYAQRVNFVYTGNLVTYTVPTTGLYQITAYGAQGSSNAISDILGNSVSPGGLGAEIGGNFDLTAGEALQIAVGGMGSNNGGGGGTFVVGPAPTNDPLVIAGGGGGGGFSITPPNQQHPYGVRVALPGGGGLTGSNGSGAEPSQPPPNGANGNGGDGCGGPGVALAQVGGGGGGFLSAGCNSIGGGTGGAKFPDLMGGIQGGGFGGGGGASSGPGGGGGYSGGAPGYVHEASAAPAPAGGGGSYDAGTDQVLVANLQTGNGEVVIYLVFAGTPGQSNCHTDVVSALKDQYGTLDAAAAILGYSSVRLLREAITVYCAG